MKTAVPLLSLLLLGACHRDDIPDDWVYAPTPVTLQIPEDFPVMVLDPANPLTKEGIALGRRLYYDTNLHPDGAMACAECHQQAHAFTSAAEVLPHVNLGWNTAFLWNGKVTGNVEDIMRFEVSAFFGTDPDRLKGIEPYRKMFYEAFGSDAVTRDRAALALAQFVRTLISGSAPYDRKFVSLTEFPTEEELRGYEIFNTEKGDCFHCHGGILFTDNQFHNNGLDNEPSSHGLSEITGNPLDLGKYKTPTLRNIAMTAPYMHDGRFATLEAVIDFYSESVRVSDTVDPLMKKAHVGGVHLTPQEKSDLLAFLRTLTDEAFMENEAFSSPF